MKKLGLIFASAVLVALVALPPVVGGVNESQVSARAAALDAHPLLTARVVEYDRGWFSSSAKIELGFDAESYMARAQAAGAADGTPELPEGSIVIAADISHGPIALGEGVHVGWSSFVARPDAEQPDMAAILERLSIPYLFEFRGRAGFTGSVAFDADMPSITVDQPNGEIEFSGATLEGVLAGRELRWALEAASLRGAEGAGRFLVAGIRGNGELEFHSRYLVTGSGEVALDGAQATSPFGQTLFEASNLRVDGSTDIDPSGEMMTSRVSYEIGSLAAADFELTDAVLGMHMGNLDVGALEAYYEALERSAAADPADAAALLQAEIEPIVQRALVRSPSLELDPIRFRWGGEPFDGNVSVEIDADALPPAAAIDLTDPLALLAALRGQARATLSKELAQDIAVQIVSAQLAMMSGPGGGMPPDQIEYMAGAQAGLMLVTLVGQGYLVDDGESYSMELAYADGTLTVNGNPLPLPLP